ncbi:MAG: hypothetical protein ACE5OQ_08730 [Woeseia sp.]
MQVFLFFVVLIFAAPLIAFASPVIIFVAPFILVGLALSCISDSVRHHARTSPH